MQASTLAAQVSLKSVSKDFKELRAILPLSLEFAPGSFTALLGPSGCGKSTLLRLIAGLDREHGGEVRSSSRSTAFVFQDAHLLPWRTVLKNVELPLELKGVDPEVRRKKALEALALMDLSEFSDRYPAQLSGGMKMRVSLARAWVTEPDLLLLDEPFAALDEVIRFRLSELLLKLWTKRRMTVIFVTHSTAEAAFMASRSVVFSARPAHVILDHESKLPVPRTSEVRASLPYLEEVKVLSRSIEAAVGAHA